MKLATLFAVLLCAPASAAPDPAALLRALPPGFAAVELEGIRVPEPKAVEITQAGVWNDTTEVDLAPLLERHLSRTDSFAGPAGVTSLGGTLDFNGDGYLAVTPPGAGTTYFFKIERNMSGAWNDGSRTYKVNLSVNIFRPRLANWIQIKDAATGATIWERRISELFRLTYAAGEPVMIAGRPYRLFYSRVPDTSRRPATPSASLGLCFIYDDTSNGEHDYKFYMVPVSQITGAAPASYKMYGGAVVRLHADPALTRLELSR